MLTECTSQKIHSIEKETVLLSPLGREFNELNEATDKCATHGVYDINLFSLLFFWLNSTKIILKIK